MIHDNIDHCVFYVLINLLPENIERAVKYSKTVLNYFSYDCKFNVKYVLCYFTKPGCLSIMKVYDII